MSSSPSSPACESPLSKMWICNTSKWGQENFLLGKMFFHFLKGFRLGVLRNSRCICTMDMFADKRWLKTTCSGTYKLFHQMSSWLQVLLEMHKHFVVTKAPRPEDQPLLGEREQGLSFWDLLTAWFYCCWAAYSENWSYGGIFSMVQLNSTFRLVTSTK